MGRGHKISLLGALALMVVLPGCGQHRSARELFGMERRAPDAFSVSTHAPLEIPASLQGSLPPPQPGAPRPQDVGALAQARSAVWGGQAVPAPATASSGPGVGGSATPASRGEAALLAQAGAHQTSPTLRSTVNAEAARDARKQHGPLDFLLFWKDKPEPGVVVNPQAEAARLKNNKAAGKAPTDGATPVEEDSGRLGIPREIR